MTVTTRKRKARTAISPTTEAMTSGPVACNPEEAPFGATRVVDSRR
jgi:regulation of enolase protein 1 (concanavalin A-like superfamily)